jgi:hypothetical protein
MYPIGPTSSKMTTVIKKKKILKLVTATLFEAEFNRKRMV